MSLEAYRGSRLVVLKPRSTVYEAARAMEANHVGAILVQERARLVGIVTDRDLALRVIGFELDPVEAVLSDVMTPNPVTVSVEAEEYEALELMRDRHVRRLPLVEGERVVGIVTLDDLLLSDPLDRELMSEVVRAQLSEPAALKPGGAVHPVWPARPKDIDTADSDARQPDRAKQALDAFEARFQELTGLETGKLTLTAFEVVVSGIVRRLPAAEANAFVSRLPRLLKEKLLALPAGPDETVNGEWLVEEMARQVDLDRERAAALVKRVCEVLELLVGRAELAYASQSLPREISALFSRAERQAPRGMGSEGRAKAWQ